MKEISPRKTSVCTYSDTLHGIGNNFQKKHDRRIDHVIHALDFPTEIPTNKHKTNHCPKNIFEVENPWNEIVLPNESILKKSIFLLKYKLRKLAA